eukprot:CAMPEP_0119323876 /NCGR_PEP_ID=MMETSP1333-20130426/61851_1 /TAXON_ID=418940 /ORGANISM="Scyphosphaera apsteinii, Strain RCC1455" /LENGTH=107 /DNA_ID=CAMNT_0007331443 /DNA_START=420 /DNA_END=743 /DNA_ORIENTATION=-
MSVATRSDCIRDDNVEVDPMLCAAAIRIIARFVTCSRFGRFAGRARALPVLPTTLQALADAIQAVKIARTNLYARTTLAALAKSGVPSMARTIVTTHQIVITYNRKA